MPDVLDTPDFAQARELPEAGAPLTGGETLHGYKIEARTTRPGARFEVGPSAFVLDNVWRPLSILPGNSGPPAPGSVVIPVPGPAQKMVEHGILPYAAAQAHRWAFHAAMEASSEAADTFETRLVLVTFKHTFEVVEVGVTEATVPWEDELDQAPLRDRESYAQKDGAGPEASRDRDAQDALGWIASGMPDEKAGHGPDAPRMADEQLGEMELASYAPEGDPALADTENADLAEEPAPKVKGKSKPKARSVPKKKKN